MEAAAAHMSMCAATWSLLIARRPLYRACEAAAARAPLAIVKPQCGHTIGARGGNALLPASLPCTQVHAAMACDIGDLDTHMLAAWITWSGRVVCVWSLEKHMQHMHMHVPIRLYHELSWFHA
jgi:hypothetical protein